MNVTHLLLAVSLAMLAGSWLLFRWAIQKVENQYVNHHHHQEQEDK